MRHKAFKINNTQYYFKSKKVKVFYEALQMTILITLSIINIYIFFFFLIMYK